MVCDEELDRLEKNGDLQEEDPFGRRLFIADRFTHSGSPLPIAGITNSSSIFSKTALDINAVGFEVKSLRK